MVRRKWVRMVFLTDKPVENLIPRQRERSEGWEKDLHLSYQYHSSFPLFPGRNTLPTSPPNLLPYPPPPAQHTQLRVLSLSKALINFLHSSRALVLMTIFMCSSSNSQLPNTAIAWHLQYYHPKLRIRKVKYFSHGAMDGSRQLGIIPVCLKSGIHILTIKPLWYEGHTCKASASDAIFFKLLSMSWRC